MSGRVAAQVGAVGFQPLLQGLDRQVARTDATPDCQDGWIRPPWFPLIGNVLLGDYDPQ